MTDLVIFGIGSVIFIFSTWATLSFGMAKMQEMRREDMDASPRIAEVKEGQYTNLYITQPLNGEQRVEPELIR